MHGYLSADIICSKRRTENRELRGTDNVQGQISEHIFAPNGGNWLYYHSNFFRNARSFEIGEYLTIILRNRAECRLILSRRGRRPSRLKADDIPRD